jgi:hypothetical protein
MGVSDTFFKRQVSIDFERALHRQIFEAAVSLFTHQKKDLLSPNDVKPLLRPGSARYLGVKEVPISRIVGSEGRYRDFNRKFFPRRKHLKERWARIDMAYYQKRALPLVKLYKISNIYFIQDGNHRVSVARAHGAKWIDAEVIELLSHVKIEPGMDSADLRRINHNAKATKNNSNNSN